MCLSVLYDLYVYEECQQYPSYFRRWLKISYVVNSGGLRFLRRMLYSNAV